NALAIFRSQKINQIEFTLDNAAAKLQATVHTDEGLIKRYAFNCLDGEVLQATVDHAAYPTMVIAEASELEKLLSSFQHTLDEITLIANPLGAAALANGHKACEIRSFVDPLKGGQESALMTSLTLDTRSVFTSYSHSSPLAADVTFNVKDFRAMTALCTALGADVALWLQMAGAPLVVEPHFRGLREGAETDFQAMLVLSTLTDSQLGPEHHALQQQQQQQQDAQEEEEQQQLQPQPQPQQQHHTEDPQRQPWITADAEAEAEPPSPYDGTGRGGTRATSSGRGRGLEDDIPARRTGRPPRGPPSHTQANGRGRDSRRWDCSGRVTHGSEGELLEAVAMPMQLRGITLIIIITVTIKSSSSTCSSQGVQLRRWRTRRGPPLLLMALRGPSPMTRRTLRACRACCGRRTGASSRGASRSQGPPGTRPLAAATASQIYVSLRQQQQKLELDSTTLRMQQQQRHGPQADLYAAAAPQPWAVFPQAGVDGQMQQQQQPQELLPRQQHAERMVVDHAEMFGEDDGDGGDGGYYDVNVEDDDDDEELPATPPEQLQTRSLGAGVLGGLGGDQAAG
ncbi:hypothetical protein VOLCADRAFT_89888, partial [Volvox carteri f. nagariensis]